MRRFIGIWMWLFALCALNAAEEVEVQFLDSRDGLPNNTVRGLYQDSRGYLWMSTSNGVSRYDGYSFVNYIPRPDKGITLADRRVNAMEEDSHGFLWLTTSAEMVSCLDLKGDRFVDFTGCGEYRQHYGYCLVGKDDVWLWGHRNGCRRITYRKGKFYSEVFSIRNKRLASDHVYFLQRDDRQRVWIGTRKGLYLYDGEGCRCIRADKAFISMQCFPDGRVTFCTAEKEILYFDGQRLLNAARLSLPPDAVVCGDMRVGDAWLFFTNNGTYKVDIRARSVQEVKGALNIPGAQSFLDAKGYGWLYNRSGHLYRVSPKGEVKTFSVWNASRSGFLGNERYRVVYDSKGVAWIASNVNGLFSYDESTDTFRHYSENDVSTALVTSDAVLSVLADRSGGLWVGSEYTGVSHIRFVERQTSDFYVDASNPGNANANGIRLITRLPGGEVVMGTRDGHLYRYNASLTQCLGEEAFGQNVYAVARDREGVLWKAFHGDGLWIGKRHYRHEPGNSSSMAFDHVYCMMQDKEGRTWLGSLGKGMDLAVPDGKGGYTFRHFLNRTYAQSNVRTLMQDKQGWIWAGTNDGVYIFSPEFFLKDGTCWHYLEGEVIKQIKEDSHGNVYISKAGAGISLSAPGRDYAHLRLEQIDTGHGLVNSTVQAFVEDRSGRMWMTTEGGVSCFDPVRKTFRNYFFSSEARRNVYNDGAALLLSDGRLALGTHYGLQLVAPDRLKDDSKTSPVVFTAMEAGGQSLSPVMESGGQSLSPVVEADGQSLSPAMEPGGKSLSCAGTVRLDYAQRTFTVRFSTLDYPLSSLPQYSYRLEGYETEWSTPSTVHMATYRNLSPGTYRLWVKARRAGGGWSGASCMDITVAAPLWSTPWAYLCYALLLGLMGFMAWRIVHKMNVLRNKIKVEAQLTEYKLAFFTNVSHEFRTPLTLIQAALERLHRLSLAADAAASVKLMAKSTNRLMRLVDQLIEFRKVEEHISRLCLEQADVVAFVADICRHFDDRAALKKMDFRFTASPENFTMYIDKEKLDKVVYNLLSNAFKYTPSQGHVGVSVEVDARTERCRISVEDTGIGIPKEKQGELFGRFMQSHFSRQSMGIGLHLSAGLVRLMKGNISYEDNPGGGSVFTVLLPTDEKVYAPSDFLSTHSVLLQEEEQWKEEMQRMEELPVEGETERTEDGPMNTKSLLLIEDDDDVRGMLKEALSAYFAVEACADGESGLEYATTHDVDLIVCDVMMPGMSGFEVTARLKTNFATSHIPVVLLTAMDDSEHYLEGIQSGADAYVTKPFSIQLLLARIVHLIRQRETLREKFSKDLTFVRPIVCTTSEEKDFADRLDKVLSVQLSNAEYSADDFAAEMGMSRTAFYKKVKGVTGYAPKEYIRVIRMKKAAELLLQGNITVAEVAYSVGMNDPLYFSRCFKAQFGMSPTAYQKQEKSDRSEVGQAGRTEV